MHGAKKPIAVQVATLSRWRLARRRALHVGRAAWVAGPRVLAAIRASDTLALALLRGDPKTADERLDDGLAGLEHAAVRPMLLRVARIREAGRAGELANFAAWCECADTQLERAELKRLLDDRNPQLGERIARLHEAGVRVFAAVGALHMLGPHGLPRLVAQQGFDVRRIDFMR